MPLPAPFPPLPEQRQHRRRGLVRLCEGGEAGLRQDVVARHVRRLFRDVRVTNAAFRSLRVDRLRLLERNRKPDIAPMVYGSILTPREYTVLQLIVAGKTTRQIASELGIAFKTAACHRSSAMGKLDVNNTAALVREAIRLGLVKEE